MRNEKMNRQCPLKALKKKLFHGKEPVKRSPLQEAVFTIQQKVNRLEKKQKHWKLYFYLTVLLPVFIVILTIQAARTYVRIKLRDVGTNAPSDFSDASVKKIPTAVPAEKIELEKVEPETVIPETVSISYSADNTREHGDAS
ncbi:MAG: hypothetical protein Q4F29_02885 [Lachnospiraceae bacterium]|nr:hypothetical protein [Lachnospiraceae bacterium]